MGNDWGDGITWHPRGDWAGDTPRYAPKQQLARPDGWRSIRYFIVHHSGQSFEHDTDTVQVLRSAYDQYVTGRRYSDLGYNAAVDDDGQVWEIREGGIQGGHTVADPGRPLTNLALSGSPNRYGYAVMYVRDRPPTGLALLALQKLYARVQALSGRPSVSPVAPSVHSDWSATACPGDDLRNWVHGGGLTATVKPPVAKPPVVKPPARPPVSKPAVPAWAGRSIRVGARNTKLAVRQVQERLNVHGARPKVAVDGIYGPRSEAAVKTFQRRARLTVDGIVGPRTWAALWA